MDQPGGRRRRRGGSWVQCSLLLGGSDPPPSSRDGLRSAGGVPSNVRPLPPLTEHLLARHERRAALLMGGGSHGPDGCWPVVIRPASSPYSARSSGLNTSRGAALQLQSDWCASGRAGALRLAPVVQTRRAALARSPDQRVRQERCRCASVPVSHAVCQRAGSSGQQVVCGAGARWPWRM